MSKAVTKESTLVEYSAETNPTLGINIIPPKKIDFSLTIEDMLRGNISHKEEFIEKIFIENIISNITNKFSIEDLLKPTVAISPVPFTDHGAESTHEDIVVSGEAAE